MEREVKLIQVGNRVVAMALVLSAGGVEIARAVAVLPDVAVDVAMAAKARRAPVIIDTVGESAN